VSLPDLAAVLWRQRELLERLVYRLECEQLLLASGRTRWLATATGEVEAVLAELAVVEVHRAATADAACRELGLPVGSSLETLAATAQPPWTGVLVDHRQVLLTLTGELSALAETNKHLMSAGMSAVEQTLRTLGFAPEGGAGGYDARGRHGAASGPSTWAVVDRTL
jgi:phage-related tail protein